MLRIHPRLLGTADYFIGLSVVVLLLVSLFHVIFAAAEMARPSGYI